MPPIAFAPPEVDVDRRADAAIVLRSRHELGAYPRHVGDLLRGWSERDPQRVFLMERSPDGSLRRVTYRAASQAADSIGQALLKGSSGRRESPRPALVLSENSIDHALFTFGAMQAGIAVAPVSAAYSLQSKDLLKLRAIVELLRPSVVFASSTERYGRVFDELGIEGDRIITGDGARGRLLTELMHEKPSEEVEARFREQTPDTVAKILFTSGSTGEPKGVLNTQRMLCSNQKAISVLWPFLGARPPIVVDWLPWSHTFGGNHNLYMVLFHGGTLLVDEGKPTPELIGKTVANLRDLPPSLYFNVPRGYQVLLPFLERDEALAKAFFGELDALFYAAASLPAPLWERLEALSIRVRGERVAMLSAWGSTETAPMATTVHFDIRRAGVIGLPAPGTEIKLAPSHDKLELRVRGPNVTPGYFDRPHLLAAALDEEGYFRMGDAGRLLDEEAPWLGLTFEGRLAEDFKLASATWVRVGAVRQALVSACAPLIQDAVITGHDRDELGALLVLDITAARALVVDGASLGIEELVRCSEVVDALRALLADHAERHPSSSTRIARALALTTPLGVDAGEITDKGYVNQRAVLERRAAQVEALYAGGEGVLIVETRREKSV